ncbi:MAG: hypothetical protein LAT84_13655 [Balneolia bacterium]|nr:hypothetical protein [Balneolia bacterium]
MRTIGRIPHPQMLITIFLWNNKYIVKFEAGPYEQSYKIDESMVNSPDDLKAAVTDEFMGKVANRFIEMNKEFGDVLQNL